MSSDVEKGNNLMITRLTPVATLIAPRTSTNHTQQSALTYKFWQITTYLLGGMNNWL